MSSNNRRPSQLWQTIAESLDIAPSLYDQAVERHRSVGDWLCRPASGIAQYNPIIRPQGSFRFGTVVRPIDPESDYDIDQIVVFKFLSANKVSQKALKGLLGEELAAYAAAHGMRQPSEHNRCWRLRYRDEVAFHLDSLPCVPAGQEAEALLLGAGVAEELAARAVAITDLRHPTYSGGSSDWLTSNPSGFARWFEQRAALGRDANLLKSLRAGSVEDVPVFRWRTPLQRSVQILKRHRDVMFAGGEKSRPISMIITNLAARAYEGESDITDTLLGIVRRMDQFVRPNAPRVPNPAHPREDYADKWATNPELERAFWTWHAQVRADVERLSDPLAHLDPEVVWRAFGVRLTEGQLDRLRLTAPALVTSGRTDTPTRVNGGPKPWAAT